MQPASPSTTRARSRGRLVAKLSLATLSTLLFFGLAELLLWALGVHPVIETRDPFVGFSSRLPLFVEQDSSGLMETAANKRTFFNAQSFPRVKAQDTLRIFCLGGSTTYGRPYDDSTSFVGWLRPLLSAAAPGRPYEVINAGGISYASYRVASVLDELTRYQPDVFIVYSGHNEFLEQRTYGRLRASSKASRRLEEWLSRTRLWTGMQLLFESLSDREFGPKVMRQVFPEEVEAVLDTSVGPSAYHRDEVLFEQVRREYRFNLERMIASARASGARILFVTPASNLAGCSPFKSENDARLSPEELRDFQAELSRISAADSPQTALEAIERAESIDSSYAHLYYEKGRALRALGRMEQARVAFERARDEDVCPLRAPGALVETLRELCRREGVPLYDFVRRIDELAPDRLPGSELFLDHVHPTIETHFVLAQALLQQLVELGIVSLSSDWSEARAEELYRAGVAAIDPKMHGRAFTNLARVVGWAGKKQEAHALALRGLELVPDDPEILYLAEAKAFDVGNYEEALEHGQAYLAIHPPKARVLNVMGSALVRLDRVEEGIEDFEQALKLEPEQTAIRHNLGLAQLRLGRVEEAIKSFQTVLGYEPDRAATHASLGRALAGAGRHREACDSFRRALELQPYLSDVRLELAQSLAAVGKQAEAVTQLRRLLAAQPHRPRPLVELALLLAGAEDPQPGQLEEALALARRACELTQNRSARPLAALAAAQAAGGDFDAAVKSAEQALALLETDAASPKRRAALAAALQDYRARRPHRP